MFVNYLTLVMLNLIAGLALTAYFVASGLKNDESLAPAFGLVGLLGLVLGLHLALRWPLPGSYNILFGESTTLFGLVFLGAALALARGWRLYPVALYAFFAGLYAVLAGYQIIAMGLTREPAFSGASFILAGLNGLFAPLALRLKDNKAFRTAAVIVLLLTALMWFVTFFGAMPGHLGQFAEWLPATMGR